MSYDNPGACNKYLNNTGNTYINTNLRELLVELRSQKTESNSLKDKIRGNSLSVASEVKKLKKLTKVLCGDLKGTSCSLSLNPKWRTI